MLGRAVLTVNGLPSLIEPPAGRWSAAERLTHQDLPDITCVPPEGKSSGDQPQLTEGKAHFPSGRFICEMERFPRSQTTVRSRLGTLVSAWPQLQEGHPSQPLPPHLFMYRTVSLTLGISHFSNRSVGRVYRSVGRVSGTDILNTARPTEQLEETGFEPALRGCLIPRELNLGFYPRVLPLHHTRDALSQKTAHQNRT